MKDISYKQSKNVDLLNTFISKVYGWMFIALLITAFTAMFVSGNQSFMQAIMGNRILFWGLMIGELVVVFVLAGALQKLSPIMTKFLFLLYSILKDRKSVV